MLGRNIGIIVHCIALRCVTLRCVALRCVALRCVALRCVALRCVALRCVALRCVALRCVALRCIALHCIALHCIVLYCIVLYCIVLYCIVLYCIVLYCIVLLRNSGKIPDRIISPCAYRWYMKKHHKTILLSSTMTPNCIFREFDSRTWWTHYVVFVNNPSRENVVRTTHWNVRRPQRSYKDAGHGTRISYYTAGQERPITGKVHHRINIDISSGILTAGEDDNYIWNANNDHCVRKQRRTCFEIFDRGQGWRWLRGLWSWLQDYEEYEERKKKTASIYALNAGQVRKIWSWLFVVD